MRSLLLLLGLTTSVLWPACAMAQPALATGAAATSSPALPPDSLPPARWYRPQHLIGQYAAGQGMAAVGVGSVVGRRRRLDLDLLAGYVPKKYSITPMGIFTAKATFSPWNLALGASRWQVRPLSVGGRISHTVSKGFNKTMDAKYDFGYYWWPAHTRAAALLGGQVSYPLLPRSGGRHSRVAAYYELGMTDLYLVSLFTNLGALPLTGILNLGFGAKIDLH